MRDDRKEGDTHRKRWTHAISPLSPKEMLSLTPNSEENVFFQSLIASARKVTKVLSRLLVFVMSALRSRFARLERGRVRRRAA